MSNKYTQNKQLFRYFVGIDSLHASKSSTLNYEVKVANTEEVKNTTLRMLSKKLNICLKCPHFLLLKHALQPGLKLECILSLLALLCLEMLQGLLQYLYLIVLSKQQSHRTKSLISPSSNATNVCLQTHLQKTNFPPH